MMYCFLQSRCKAYKEYYAYAVGEAAPKPKASARKKKGETASSTTPPTPTPTTTVESAPRLSVTAKGKQPTRAISPTEPTDVQRTKVKQLKIVLKRSRQKSNISQQRGSGTDKGNGSKPGVPDVPSDDSEEEISWNSSDDEDVGGHEEGDKSDESDDDSDETVKAGAGKDDDNDDEDDDDNDEEEEIAKSDEEDTETGKGGHEVRESEESEEESNDEEDQDLRLSEEARIQEEEDADELYRDVNINQGRGLHVTQNVEDSYVTLTPVNPDGPQESSTMSSFMTTFRFDERLRSLETSFSEYRQTNPFADAVSVIPGIVHQYMTQQMTEAVREAAFREMLHISPRIPNQSFAELPSEEEILDFLRFLGHSHEIRYLTDVNVNKLYQPWRSFASVINKCLTGKSSGVEHKNQKRSNEMYYPRFMKVIIDYFMTRKPSISRRNIINWYYVRDDILFSTIKVVSRHQTTQQYGAILSIELTNDKIRNSKAYKEYYACATGEVAPKLKASARKKKCDWSASSWHIYMK
nr:hypothetical protein [Tanacetum cinerariifolium]